MSSRAKKIIALVLAVALLFGTSRVQQAMNRDRETLGLTHADVLDDAPPVLVFTTVVLGGFRGLISNALWIRASDLQEQDKFFEAAQLADWITKLEPHFSQVWVNQAWNMSYNISVKFKDFSDRWNWVQRGFELLRDQALKFNPDDVLIYQQLAWHFQHKIGANLDDASMYYKEAWAKDMADVLDGGRVDSDDFIHPQTADMKARTNILIGKYKLDPVFMKQVDEKYGPLEWRLPEAHAIYWAALGLKKAEENPGKVKPEDLLQLRRVIYQDMQTDVMRGRLIPGVVSNSFELGPNLDIIRKTSDAYEQAMKDEPRDADNIHRAHRNLVRQAVYFLYEYNRMTEAAEWFKYLGERYPNDNLITGTSDTKPSQMTLGKYVVARIQEDMKDTSHDKTKAFIDAALRRSYLLLISGEDDHAVGTKNIAHVVWQTYQSQVPAARQSAIGLPPFDEMDRAIQSELLESDRRLLPQYRAILRSRLNMVPEEVSTNNPAPVDLAPVAIITNTPPEVTNAFRPNP